MIGEFLINEGLADKEIIEKALAVQKKSGGRLGDILQATGGIRALDYYRALSSYYGLEFIDLTKDPPEEDLVLDKDKEVYAAELILPVTAARGVVTVVTADPCERVFQLIRSRWGQDARVAVTSKFDIFWTLQRVFDVKYTDEIISELYERSPEKSALKTFTWPQMVTASFLVLSFIVILYIHHPTGMVLFNSFLTVSISVVLVYKFILSGIGLGIPSRAHEAPVEIDEKTLPVYTILVPMFMEKKVTVEHLVDSILRLDYPAHKLDVKLVLEGDDDKTIEIVKGMKLPLNFEIFRVPPGEPRTKPKACNYALKFAKGEFITIYDAEDRPDPGQLKTAIQAFREDGGIACVQSALNYYNSRDNWLTRMFTIEYTNWFDLMLPALSKLKHPIPLGGTSNHFRTAFLKQMVAWDPFNVTEDADLGIRMSRLGYVSKVISSTTYEEANCRTISWIKQRTRWLKGYMQTYLVHMRSPAKLYRELGAGGFLSFQLFIGGTVLSNLANIILYVIFFIWLLAGADTIDYLFPSPTYELALINFVVGNAALILMNILSIYRRRMYGLIPYALTAPLYWLLGGIASYRALHQLFFRPSYWDKTEHGISKVLTKEGKVATAGSRPEQS